MEKKEYTEPSMIVRHVGAVVMAALSDPHDQPGSGEDLSKENFGTDEGNSGSNLEIRDVWED